MFVAETRKTPKNLTNTALNTDNHPIIEFSAPKHALTITTDRNQSVLMDMFEDIPEYLTDGLSPKDLASVENTHEALLKALQANVQRGDNLFASMNQLRKAHKQAPGNPVIRHRLADILIRYAQAVRKQGKWIQSIMAYEEVLQLRPDEFWAHFHLVRHHLKNKNFEKAKGLLNHALAIYPDSGVLYSLKGFYEFQAGNKDAAIDALNRSVELYPSKAVIWDTYSGIMERLGRYDEATEARKEAAKIRNRF